MDEQNDKHSRESEEVLKSNISNKKIEAENETGDTDEESEENTDDERDPPLQLLVETVAALVRKDYKVARKLCKMVLLYDTNHEEANNLLAVIDEKEQLEAEAEADSSTSEETSTDSDESDVDSNSEDDNDSDNDSPESSSSEECTEENIVSSKDNAKDTRPFSSKH